MEKEKFEFTSGIKRKIITVGLAGVLLLLIGAILPSGGHGDDHGG